MREICTLNCESTEETVNLSWGIKQGYLNWDFVLVRWVMLAAITTNPQISVSSYSKGASKFNANQVTPLTVFLPVLIQGHRRLPCYATVVCTCSFYAQERMWVIIYEFYGKAWKWQLSQLPIHLLRSQPNVKGDWEISSMIQGKEMVLVNIYSVSPLNFWVASELVR